MASETVSSDHPPSTPKPVEKEVSEEVKTMEHEAVSPPKESEEMPKDEKSPSLAAPQVELAEKIEEKQSEAPNIEEVTKTNEKEKPKAEDSPAVEEVTKTDAEEKPNPEVPQNETVSSAEPEDKIKDKHAEASDVQKPDDTPLGHDASPKDNPELVKGEISNAVEQAADNVESKPEEQIEVKSLEKATEVASDETTKERKEELPKKIDVPESLVEAVEKEEEKKEKLPEKEPESAAEKDAETSQAESGKEAASVLVPVEEDKSVMQPAITEETGKESVAAEPKEVEVEVEKDKETSTEKTEESKLMEEEQATPAESSDQVTSTNKDIAVKAKDVESTPAECVETKENKPTDVVEEPVKEKIEVENETPGGVVETKEKKLIDVVEEPVKENVEVKNEATEVKTEEKGKRTEEPALPETTVKTEVDKTDRSEALVRPEKTVETEEEKGEKTEELTKPKSLISAEATSLAEKVVEGTNTSRDIETIAENGSRKDEIVPPIETNKEGLIEKKVDEVTATTTASVPLGELLKPEPEAKEAENLEAAESEVKKEKEADETAKPDIQSTESTKDAEDKKTSQDTSKEEVPAKTKQSNNILTKVKRSLMKAKKAITGKSPNSKIPSSETKDDVTA